MSGRSDIGQWKYRHAGRRGADDASVSALSLIHIWIVAANRAVVTKVYIPKYFLIIILLFQNLFKMMISFGIVIVMMLWSHVAVSYNVIYVIPIFVDLILITFGVSAILAHFGVFFDDLKNITNVGLRILFYMSGIFYVITDRVNEAIATLLLKVNPVGFLIDACRSSLVYCETPHRCV